MAEPNGRAALVWACQCPRANTQRPPTVRIEGRLWCASCGDPVLEGERHWELTREQVLAVLHCAVSSALEQAPARAEIGVLLDRFWDENDPEIAHAVELLRKALS